jgi:hypothetical protein
MHFQRIILKIRFSECDINGVMKIVSLGIATFIIIFLQIDVLVHITLLHQRQSNLII